MTRFARSFFYLALLLVGGWMLSLSPVLAAPQINNQINYQARLMDASGFPVADGNYSIIFSLYDASTSGNRIWTAAGTLVTPTALTVNVQNGLFTILLGDTGQNTLDTVNWNSDQIFLGVTINADSEMSPRKRFASAPQAFNARQLQGMYASSTASGGQTLFTVNQTEANSATGTRTALVVRTNGTSNANDFLIRGLDDTNATVFSVNRQGVASSTQSIANIATYATATVAGQGICLSNGQFCSTGSLTESDTLQTVTNRGAFTTTTLSLFGGLTTSNLTATGTTSLQNVSAGTVTAANLLTTGITSSTRYFADDGTFSTPAYSFTSSQNSGMYMTGGNLALSRAGTAMIIATASGVSINFGLFPIAPALQDIGSSGLEWRNAWFSGTVTSTAIAAATGTFSGALTVTGQSVCLANGTNCPASTGTDTLLTVSNRGAVATSTLSLYGGFVAASSSVTGTLNVAGTSNLLGDVYVGTSTYSVTLNSDFVIDGNDLYAEDMIGSVSSIFSNGMFVAGESDSTLFGNGFIRDMQGELLITTNDASFIQPTINIIAGDGTSLAGGHVNIRAGDALSPGPPAGNITLTPGDTDFGNPGHVYINPAGTTNQPRLIFTSVGGGVVSLEAPSTTNSVSYVLPFANGASSTVIGTNGSGNLTFVSVCLTDGTNCPASGGSTDLNWTFNLAGDFVRNATATTDIAIGSSTLASAPFVFLNNTTTSRFLIGQNPTIGAGADLVIGATTSSGMNASFQLTGDDLFVGGNIGSASSVYTNGAFIAGSGSTIYGNGYINKNDGNLVIAASGGFILPASDLATSLGSLTARYNGYFGSTTSTNSSSTSFFASSLGFTNASGVSLTANSANFATATIGGVSLCLSSGVGCPSGVVSNESLLTVSNRGAVATSTLTLFGGFVAASSTVTGTLNVVGTLNTTAQTNFASASGSSLDLVNLPATLTEVAEVTVDSGGEANISSVVTVGNITYLAGATNGFFVYDTHDPVSPQLLGAVTLEGNTSDMVVRGSYAYVARDAFGDIDVIDITSSSAPFVAATLNFVNQPEDVTIEGKYLIVGFDNGNFTVYTLDNPIAPTLLSSVDVGPQINEVLVRNGIGYALTGTALHVIRLGDFSSLSVLASTTISGSTQRMDISGSNLYLASSGGFVNTIDISDPTDPTITATTTVASASGITVSGNYAYVGGSGVIHVLDVTSSTNVFQVRQLSVGTGGFSITSVAEAGRYLYVGHGAATLFSARFSVVDIGGLETHAASIGNLAINSGIVGDFLSVGGSLDVRDGITVGYSGINAMGGISAAGTSTFGTVSATRVTIGGFGICLANGSNCPSYSLQAVATNGSFATSSLQFYGGFTAASSSVTGTFRVIGTSIVNGTSTVTGSSSLNGVDFVRATGTSVTTTNLFATHLIATNASTTNLVFTRATGTSVTTTQLFWSNATATDLFLTRGNFGNVTSTNFFVNTMLGFTSATGVTLTANIFSAATSSITAINFRNATGVNLSVLNTTTTNLAVTGVFSASNLTWTNATGSLLTVTTSTHTFSSIVTVSSTELNVNSAKLVRMGQASSSGSPTEVFVSGRYAYVNSAAFADINIYDISDPRAPTSVSSIQMPGGNSGNAYVIGDYLYTGNQGSTLRVYDITNRRVPALVSELTGPTCEDCIVSGRYLYSVDSNSFDVVDIVNATSPRLIFSSTTVNGEKIRIQGSFAYAVMDAAVKIFDIANATSPIQIASIALTSPAALAVSGRYLYTNNSTVIRVYDIADPYTPTLMGSVNVGNSPGEIDVGGKYLYITHNDLSVVDVSSSTNPVIVIQDTSINSNGIDVYGRYGVVGISGGIQIIDFGGLETHAARIGVLEVGSITGWNDADFGGTLRVGTSLQVGRQGIFTHGSLAVGATNTTSTIAYAVSSTRGEFSSSLSVGGVNVCLSNGTNCPASGGATDLNWTLNLAGDFVRNATATTDIAIGSSTLGNAPFVFLNNTTTSRFLIGQNPTIGAGADLVIGATTSSGMNTAFQLTGDDLFVGGNIGSASSVYTNGAFIAGPGSTMFGDGYIRKTNGDLTLSASGDLLVGSTTTFMGNVGFGTSTPIAQLYVPGRAPASAIGSILGPVQSYSVFVEGRLAYVADAATGFESLEIYDISNPSSPVSVGAVSTTGANAIGMHVQGQYAYTLNQNSDSMDIIDVSNPSLPVVVSTAATGDGPVSIVVHGKYAYVVNQSANNFQVFDVSNPFSATLVSTNPTILGPAAGVVQGRYFYVVGFSTGLEIFDLLNPSAPVSVGTVSTGAGSLDIFVQGSYAYVVNNTAGNLQIINITNPSTPVSVGTVSTGDGPYGVYVQGRSAYVTNNGGSTLAIIDVSNPSAPVHRGFVATDSGPTSLHVQGRFALVVNNSAGGLQVFDVGGAYIQQLEVGGLEAGALTLNGSLQGEDASFQGGLTVGQSVNISGGLSVGASSTQPTSNFINRAVDAGEQNWGAYIDQLSVGSNASATGTANYSMVLTYASSATMGGLCIDDTTDGNNCPSIGGNSIASDGPIAANRFDLAEMYSVTGTTEAGDVLVLDASSTAMVMRSTGTPYDSKVIGIVSTDPGFVLGWGGGAKVALTGRVPTKISMNNGSIAVGDALVSSDVPGYAMKATQPGMILGYALESISATGTAQVFVSVGFWAGLAFSPTGQIQIDDSGNVSIMNDLHIGGKLFPSLKGGGIQNDWYLFVNADDPTSTYISTNAAGFMSMDSYDFAERYYSPDELEPGDLVIVSDNGRTHVQRSLNADQMLLGIVSTRPAFIAGRPATSTYPIALSGRVPTKVSNMNGVIKAGDPLAPTTIPGVAAKAIHTGPIIGLALEDFEGANIDKIEVFVNPGYWVNESEVAEVEAPAVASQIVVSTGKQGFATIVAGSKKVRIEFPSLGAYPNVQATPRGSTKGGWWTDSYTDTGFEIILSETEDHDVVFAWRVDATTSDDVMRMSDGTYATVDPVTGVPTGWITSSSTEPVIDEPVLETPVVTPTTTEETAPLTEEVSTATTSVLYSNPN